MNLNDKKYKEQIKDICEKCHMTCREDDMTSDECDSTTSRECDSTTSRKCDTTSNECDTLLSDECDSTTSRKSDMTCECHCRNKNKPHISINCNLQVELDNKNRAIYLSPGRVQFFVFKVLKSCGEVLINHKRDCHCSEIIGRLARYKIVGNGIIVYPKSKLNPRDVDILHFRVRDKCTDSCINFAAVFSFNPCTCCKKNNK